jgi:cell division protein ZapD
MLIDMSGFDHKKSITYEHPLNEKMRIFLRLEYLFGVLNRDLQLNHRDHSDHSIEALLTLLQLVEVCERFDLKSDTFKHLDRLFNRFSSLRESVGIDQDRLDLILNDIEDQMVALQSLRGKFAAPLIANDWLTAIRQKMLVPGALCPGDTPFLHHWLQHSLEARLALLQGWRDHFVPLSQALNTILTLTRKSANAQICTASHGGFQKQLNPQRVSQLVRVRVENHLPVYPEVSGNKHRITIRFMQGHLDEKAFLFQQALPFQLFICA